MGPRAEVTKDHESDTLWLEEWRSEVKLSMNELMRSGIYSISRLHTSPPAGTKIAKQ